MAGQVAAVLGSTKAKTALGGVRFGAANVVDEVPSTFLDDNQGGSAVQLLGLMGIDPEVVKNLEPVKPGMSRTEASMAAFGPNLTASLALAGGGAASPQDCLLAREHSQPHCPHITADRTDNPAELMASSRPMTPARALTPTQFSKTRRSCWIPPLR